MILYQGKVKLEIEHTDRKHDYLVSKLLPKGIWTDPVPKSGVTSYLNVIPKFLLQWSANEASGYWLSQLRDGLTEDKWEETYDEARYAHRAKADAGKSRGTDLHAVVEKWLTDPTYQPEDDPEVKPEVFKLFFIFREWWNESKYEPIGIETPCYSLSLDYCGKCDVIAKTPKGKIILGDVKSSKSGVYLENFYQLGGYALALLEEGTIKQIDDLFILNPHVVKEKIMQPVYASHFGMSVEDAIRGFSYCKTLTDNLKENELKFKQRS